MHISEPRVDPILIKYVIKIYELEWKPQEPIKQY